MKKFFVRRKRRALSGRYAHPQPRVPAGPEQLQEQATIRRILQSEDDQKETNGVNLDSSNFSNSKNEDESIGNTGGVEAVQRITSNEQEEPDEDKQTQSEKEEEVELQPKSIQRQTGDDGEDEEKKEDDAIQTKLIQRQSPDQESEEADEKEEEEEPVQAKMIQRQSDENEEEEEELQTKAIQRETKDDETEEEPVQTKRVQRRPSEASGKQPSMFSNAESASKTQSKNQQNEIHNILHNSGAQAKLTVGKPDDKYEQEADRVADKVLRMTDSDKTQRQTENDDEIEEEDKNETVQTKQINTNPLVNQITPLVQSKQTNEKSPRSNAMSDAATDAVSSKGSGSPMQPDVRDKLESGIGADFSQVRIHDNSQAQDAAKAINAKAFTHKNDIWLGSGQSQNDIGLMAHEATHVVQQGAADSLPQSQSKESLSSDLASRYVQNSPSIQNSATQSVIQRRRSNGVSVSRMRFSPRKIKDDGVTTTQASVSYSRRRMAGPASLIWSLDGVAHGATINAANGLITPGTDTVPADKDKVRVTAKAVDSGEPGAFTTGRFWMHNQKVVQAKADVATLRGSTLSVDPFQARSVNPATAGKFAATYNVRRRRLTAEVRIKYNFVSDGVTPWRRNTKRRYIRNMVRQVNRAWSGQWTFNVEREPKRVWRTLGPVSVRVRAKSDDLTPHFVMAVHKAPVSPSRVNQNTQTGRIDADDAQLQRNPFPNTKAAELAALRTNIPNPVLFNPGLPTIKLPADQTRLEFLARYLRAIRNPSFNITMTGHAQLDAAPATPRATRAAARAANTLSRQRARVVRDVLRSRNLRAHRIRTTHVGNRGAASTDAWDKVAIASAVSRRYVNRYNIQRHEFGHMLGLRDEYPDPPGRKVNDNTQHYGLVKAALGQDYADAFSKVQADSEGIMNGGVDVRPHHYVTFWQVLSQLTAAEAKPLPALGEADWKFVGV